MMVTKIPRIPRTVQHYKQPRIVILEMRTNHADVRRNTSSCRNQQQVFVLRHMRPQLEGFYESILDNPPLIATPLPARDFPDLPTYDDNGITGAGSSSILSTAAARL